jgi:hypothetical protein
MKISDLFILRNIAGESLLIPVGEAALNVKGLISMSESAAMMFEKLKNNCTREELIAALMAEYEVDEITAEKDTDAFLDQMYQLHILTEE